MREIKFKVIHIGSMQYIEPNIRTTSAIAKDKGIVYNTQVNTSEPLIWLQYTGLKDINGKEIYEGDIVKHIHNDGSMYRMPYIVQFMINYSYDQDILGYNIDLQDPVTEIIGNIYENPELLENFPNG